jgi:hypothetical protein
LSASSHSKTIPRNQTSEESGETRDRKKYNPSTKLAALEAGHALDKRGDWPEGQRKAMSTSDISETLQIITHYAYLFGRFVGIP